MPNIPDHVSDDPRYQRLQEFFKQHPDAVLTPHILKHWDLISAMAKDACRVSLSSSLDMAETFQHHMGKAPPLLPDILRYALGDGSRLDKWEMTERYLKQQGFTSESVDFFTCGGEALVFTVKGCPDLLLKVHQEYKLPNLVPFTVKAISKAVFPMSKWEPQDGLHALQEFDPTNVARLSDNKQSYGSSEQIALALVPRLGAHYMDIRKIGDKNAVSYSTEEWKEADIPPAWSEELAATIRSKLAQNKELVERMAKISIRGVKGLERQINLCVPFESDETQEYALNDKKYDNFAAFTGFENMPFCIDRSSVAVENIGDPRDSLRLQGGKEISEEFKTYYDFLALVRQIYHDKYGTCDKTFSTAADMARNAAKEAWRKHLKPSAGEAGNIEVAP